MEDLEVINYCSLSHWSFLGKSCVKFKEKNPNMITYIYSPFNGFIL